jgi:hypothetical protein
MFTVSAYKELRYARSTVERAFLDAAQFAHVPGEAIQAHLDASGRHFFDPIETAADLSWKFGQLCPVCLTPVFPDPTINKLFESRLPHRCDFGDASMLQPLIHFDPCGGVFDLVRNIPAHLSSTDLIEMAQASEGLRTLASFLAGKGRLYRHFREWISTRPPLTYRFDPRVGPSAPWQIPQAAIAADGIAQLKSRRDLLARQAKTARRHGDDILAHRLARALLACKQQLRSYP